MAVKPTALMGWCMTGEHEKCRARYVSDFNGQERVCSCACHKREGE